MPRKAALRASPAIDEPNLVIPLATSYNERGVAGYTHSVTNSEDQRKINCFYELAKNVATGKGTLTLSKRPGVTQTSDTLGTSTQDVYLVNREFSVTEAPILYSKLGNDIRESRGGTTTIILTSAGHFPAFIDVTAISNAQYNVLQLSNLSNLVQRVFYQTGVGAWTEILDADFTGLVHLGKMEHMDGYAFILCTLNTIVNSDINSLANWTATSFIAKQIVQDFPVGLARLNNQILAFGDNTVEMFYNAGNTTGSPLLPLRHLHRRIGLIKPNPRTISGAGHYYCVISGKLYFIGREAGRLATASAFAYDGQSFDKISSIYIDKILSEEAQSSFYSVNSMSINGQSAVAFLLTSPNATSQRWLMFFPDWKEWFEWTSTVFSPINDGNSFLGCASNTKNKIYNLTTTDNWQDNSVSYPWSTQFKLPTNGSARRFMPMYGVDADTDTSANSLTVEISTDDSKTFSMLGTIDQTQDRKVLFRGGSFRKAHIRLGNTNARPTRIHNFLARLE